ncbi:MAG: hypothetical protein A3D92_01840 [Bacteroidetes bacterium RIFCSPHIGHO2_02_FULL_44_7]|nr:MAG: hypothetical protein A3D92_01840 [Bacteroidetes bacterium RIFCSPHIGHO2_02_FULL_44_7]
MGLIEAADLLVDFLKYIQENKVTDYENVISASSMSSDIATLALLKMEALNEIVPNFPHHHSRLVIHFDANVWGANLPYSSLLQIYSGYLNPSMNTIDLQTSYLRTYLFATMEQKATQELLRYHPAASIGNLEYFSPILTKTVIPKTHARRLNFYSNLNLYQNSLTNTANNNHQYIAALPRSPRHVAISLGKYKDENNVNQDGTNFVGAGDLWVSGVDHILRAAKHSTSPELLFRRHAISPGFTSAHHNIYVKEMLPIDNASGSFFSGIGNILFVSILTYRNEFAFPIPSIYMIDNPMFSHKSVVTALAINPDLWSPQHTMTLDLQTLGLMYRNVSELSLDVKSTDVGYPNLGRPNDHFSVTPFEAIYVDDQPDQHIRLDKSDYITELVEFINGEVEPSWLYLQNSRVGTQVLPPKEYRIKRQALTAIVTGYQVTHQTDPGNYMVEANGVANLQAGELVELMPGTEFKSGSDVWVHILYEGCTGGKAAEMGDNQTNELNEFPELHRAAPPARENLDQTSVVVYPNPSKGFIAVACSENSALQSVDIYTISGNLVYTCRDLKENQHKVPIQLEKGTYVVNVGLEEGISHHKLIVL